MRAYRHIALAATIALAACSKPPPGTDAPLAYVPADTPYVYANLDPLPAEVTENWSRRVQEYLPTMASMYDAMLQDSKLPLGARPRRIAITLLDELKTHSSWDQLRAIGFKPDARAAVYGMGLVPVLRLELADPAALRAEIARVEKAAGASMPVAKTGDQEYWQVGDDTLALAIAIEGSQLVVTMLPPNGSDALKQQLLGLKRPAQNLGDGAVLEKLNSQYGFSRYGAGYVDVVRLVERLSKPLAGSDAEFAQALKLPAIAADETCQREFGEIAHTFPRLVLGAEELSVQRMRIVSQLEIEPGLAGRIAAALGAAPGTGAPAEGAADFSLALPVLKLKDFWVAQATAAAAHPYACAKLQELNTMFAESKAKLDVTVPPPLSDLAGVRVSVSSVDFGTPGATPDVSGKLLIATSNPMAAVAMAQLAVPSLQQVKLAPDGKPVALPPDVAPVKLPPTWAAMSTSAIALATGKDEAASLPAFLNAPAAKEADFLRMHVTGAVYGWMARGFTKMQAAMPDESRKTLDQQIALFGMYEKWLRSNDVVLTATPTGIRMRQTLELN